MNAFEHEDALTAEIRKRIKAAGEFKWQRYPLPWTHPSFKSCPKAARNLLHLFADAQVFLVMRDACLSPVGEAVLDLERTLVIPTRYGDGLLQMPGRALDSNLIRSGTPLRISTPPPGAKPYTGPVDVVVVACLAFNRFERRLHTFELERTAYVLEQLRDGGRLGRGVPVVCIAADQQEVEGWPEWAQGFVEANVVVTPTRAIALGSGEEVGMEADEGKEVDGQKVEVGYGRDCDHAVLAGSGEAAVTETVVDDGHGHVIERVGTKNTRTIRGRSAE